MNEDTLTPEEKHQLQLLTAEANLCVKEMKRELSKAHRKMTEVFSLIKEEKSNGRSI